MLRPMQVPRAGELLARMDDVVDLAVLLRRPGPHVGARVRVRVEAPDVALPQVEGRFAVDQPLPHLAEVHGLVLVAQDRLGDLPVRAGQLRERCRDGIEVLHRRQRNGDSGQPAQLGSPDPGGGHHDLRPDLSMIGMDSGDPPAGDVEAGDLHAAVEGGTAALGLPGHRLGRAEQMGLEAPAHGVPGPGGGWTFPDLQINRRLVRVRCCFTSGTGLFIRLNTSP